MNVESGPISEKDALGVNPDETAIQAQVVPPVPGEETREEEDKLLERIRVKIGTFTTPEALSHVEPDRHSALSLRAGALYQAMRDARFLVDNLAVNLMTKPAFDAGIAREEEDVEFVIASGKQLGCPGLSTMTEIRRVAAQHGFRICESSDGCELRLAYRDQPTGSVSMCMNAIRDSFGDLRAFALSNYGHDKELFAGTSPRNALFPGNEKWVFRCDPKPDQDPAE